jgi:putative ABC transport system substrate-binding protein
MQFAPLRRRDFVTLLGGAAAWPLTARAQPLTVPEIGYLSSARPDPDGSNMRAFRQGLSETGYIEGRNLAIEYRWADGQYDRLPALAAELASRHVRVIATSATAPALAAKSATATIPIVFSLGADPVKIGLVASLNRPGGNITGVSFLANLLPAKLLELLHDVVPGTALIGLLVNPANPNVESDVRDVLAAADTLGQKILVVKASTDTEIDAAFATAVQQHVAALEINSDPFLSSRREQLVALAARYALPTINWERDYAAAGGLMSYGASGSDTFRLIGLYAGRILKGEKPADLPVQQSTKVELIINLKTAKALGITVPQLLLGRADEIIE